MELLQPPPIAGRSWQVIRRSDARALQTLARHCGLERGDVGTISAWAKAPGDDRVAFALDGDGALRVALQVKVFARRDDEQPVQLALLCDHDVANGGSQDATLDALLAWFSHAVSDLVPAEEGVTLRERVAIHGDTSAYERSLVRGGYRIAFCEEELRCEAKGTGQIPDLSAWTLAPWSAEHAPRFFDAYVASFSDRPGFPGWPEATWIDVFTGYPTFRPDLSFILSRDGAAAAYLLAAVEPDPFDGAKRVCWVVQFGVVPARRGRGLGADLLRAIHALAAQDGCVATMLSVNIDNRGARRLYERAGYRRVGRCSVYSPAEKA